MSFRKIAIIGVGLLGGSLGMAVKRRKLAHKVIGFVRRPASIAECKEYRAVDYATQNLQEAAAGADLIVLCTPLARMQPLVKQMLPALKRGAIVTDVGSVKACVIRELETMIVKAGAHFIGSHPMAGAEKTGVSASRLDLFVNAACVVTPTRKSNKAALRKVERFWQAVGCRLLRLAPEVHDALVSRSSHLPHMVAATLVNRVLSPVYPAEQAGLCANGFRDTTRIASGSPEMWRDIALANRTNIARALDQFSADLIKLKRILKRADGKALAAFFEEARQRRNAWCASKASPSPE